MATIEEHPTAELDRLIAGRATPEERRRAVAHLLRGCPRCSRRVARGLRISAQSAPRPADLRRAVSRAVERLPALRAEVSREEAQAERLLERLEGQPHGRALMVLASSRRHQRRAVAERLLAEVREVSQDDPHQALQLAEQAITVARRYDGPASDDLQARTWMLFGNLRRLTGDLMGAETAFAEAAVSLEADGGTDPSSQADFFLMLAGLRLHQRRFEEALRLNERGQALFARLHCRHGVATARLQKATILAESGESESAVQETWRALLLLGPKAELTSLFRATHNLLHFLAEAGHHRLAADLMETARPIYEACAGETDLARLDWARARLYLQQQDWLDDAGWLLEEVRERFAALDLPYEVALVSLDLATVYARQGRTFELHEVARETLPTFRRLGVARETLAALTLLRRALAHDTATVELIQKLAGAVAGERGAKNPPPAPRR